MAEICYDTAAPHSSRPDPCRGKGGALTREYPVSQLVPGALNFQV